jgi:hypothetical protein
MALSHHLQNPDGRLTWFMITTLSDFPGRGYRVVEVDEDGRMLPCPDCRRAGNVAADQDPISEPIGAGAPTRLAGAMLLNPQLPECHHPTFPGWWADVMAARLATLLDRRVVDALAARRPDPPPIGAGELILAQLAASRDVDAVQQLVQDAADLVRQLIDDPGCRPDPHVHSGRRAGNRAHASDGPPR